MSTLVINRHFAAPADQLWSVMTDIENHAERISGIQSLEIIQHGDNQRVGKGTRFRETRKMFGKEATEEMTITHFDPATREYVVEGASCGCHYHVHHRIAPAPGGNGCDLTLTWTTTPQKFLAKMMSPLGKLMQGTIRKCMEKDFDDLERAVTGAGSAAAPAAG